MRGPRDFRAFNADGFFVDLIRPEDDLMRTRDPRATLGDRQDDLPGAPLAGLQWLISAPRFEIVRSRLRSPFYGML